MQRDISSTFDCKRSTQSRAGDCEVVIRRSGKHGTDVRQEHRLHQIDRAFADGAAVQSLGAGGATDYVAAWNESGVDAGVNTDVTRQTVTNVLQLQQSLKVVTN